VAASCPLARGFSASSALRRQCSMIARGIDKVQGRSTTRRQRNAAELRNPVPNGELSPGAPPSPWRDSVRLRSRAASIDSVAVLDSDSNIRRHPGKKHLVGICGGNDDRVSDEVLNHFSSPANL
jgi:hypothetical protein